MNTRQTSEFIGRQCDSVGEAYPNYGANAAMGTGALKAEVAECPSVTIGSVCELLNELHQSMDMLESSVSNVHDRIGAFSYPVPTGLGKPTDIVGPVDYMADRVRQAIFRIREFDARVSQINARI